MRAWSVMRLTLLALASLALLLAVPAATATASATESDEQVAICVYGDAYNTGGRPCQGAVCIGYTMGNWVNCYPRLPPCWSCPPPPAARLA